MYFPVIVINPVNVRDHANMFVSVHEATWDAADPQKPKKLQFSTLISLDDELNSKVASINHVKFKSMCALIYYSSE